MKPILLLMSFVTLAFCGTLFAQGKAAYDEFKIDDGTLKIYFIGHGTLMFDCNGTIIHVDPVGREGNYDEMPKADLILVTHEHGDHLDADAIGKIRKDDTAIVLNLNSFEKLGSGRKMKNGDVATVKGFRIEAVPAYNTSEGRDRFHPKDRDNGYVVTMGGKRVYIAGDTEDIPELKNLKDIDIAFLPMNQPYTMTPEQAAKAAKSFMPKVLYPYHFGDTDTSKLVKLLSDVEGIEVRIRDLK